MNTQQYEIEYYGTSDGRRPFTDWLESIRDAATSRRIRARIDRFQTGNLGDHKPLKNAPGVWEARLNFGPGYRIYFAKERQTIILLLCGGDKGSQENDIRQATEYYEFYQAAGR